MESKKIIGFYVENFMGCKIAEFTPEKNITIVSGANGQGKSSLIDSMWFLFTNLKGSSISEPINYDAEYTVVTAELSNGFTIDRIQKKSGQTSLKIKWEGAILQSPQSVLNKLLGLNIDPMELLEKEPKYQVDYLLSRFGLKDKLNELESKRIDIYTKRKYVNKEIKNLEVLTANEITEPDIVDNQKIKEKLKKLQEAKSTREKSESKIKEIENAVTESEQKKEFYKKEIEKINEQNEQRSKNLIEIQDSLSKIPSLENLESQIDVAFEVLAEADETAMRLNQYKEYQKNIKLLETRKEEAGKLSSNLLKITNEKIGILEQLNFDIENLEIKNGELLYNNIPLSQSSSAEQLKACTEIAIKTIPKDGLRVILIRDGNRLDSNNFKILEELSRKNDVQIIIERVDETGEQGLYMENGVIKKNNYNKE